MKSNKETNEATIKYFVSDDGNINEHHFSDMRRVLDQDPGLFFIPILNKYNKLQFPLFILADLIRTTSHGRIHEKFSNLFKELYFSIIKELATSENSKQKLTNLKDDDGMNIFQTLATSCHEWAISVLQRLLDQNLISISNIVPEGDKLIFVFPHKSLPMILFLLKSGVKQEDIIAYDPPALNKAGHFSQIVEIPLVHYL